MVATAGTKDSLGFSISTHSDSTDTHNFAVDPKSTATTFPGNRPIPRKLTRRERRMLFNNKKRKLW